MPEFVFEALTRTGEIEKGRLTAADENALADRLREEGSYLVRIADPEAAKPRTTTRRRTDARLRKDELLAFTEYMAGATEMGIPLLEALEDVRHRLPSRRMRTIVKEIAEDVAEQGMSVSDALREHPKAFSRLYVGTVAAGEATGHLDFALEQLAQFLDWQRGITVQIRQALIYPVLLVVVITLLMVVLVMFVYPRLLPVIMGYGAELPWPTRVLQGTADFLNAYWLVMVASAVGIVALGWAIRRSTWGRLATDTLALKLPIFGSLIHRINMARLATYFALLYRTGVELMHSLTLMEEMIENRRVSGAVGRVREAVIEGRTMAAAFGEDPVFPLEIVRAVSLGESTGSLDKSLGRVQAYYAREVPAAVDRMLAALQPTLILFLAGVILFVALSVVLPIVSIYENIGGVR